MYIFFKQIRKNNNNKKKTIIRCAYNKQFFSGKLMGNKVIASGEGGKRVTIALR